MIRMKKYDRMVEMAFLETVEKVVDIDDRANIVDSFRRYFPIGIIPDGIDELDAFGRLILADYETLMKLYKGISQLAMQTEVFTASKCFTELYQIYHDSYDKIIKEKIGNEKLNVFLVRNSRTYTCPYCNRNYITVRGEKAAGAQLDHFINRKDYPIFALSLYNLVPSCNVCNLIKGKNNLGISPFNPSLDDDYIKFEKSGSLLANNLAVIIKASNVDMEKNVDILRLQEAYDIHKDDLKELMELQEMYPESQVYEICELINIERKAVGKPELTATDISDMVFGKQIPYEEYGKKPLAKFRHDILKELHVYS